MERLRRLRFAAPAPILIRAGVLVAAGAALLLTYPHMVFLLVIGVLPAAFPRGWVPTVFMSGMAVAWLIATPAELGDVPIWRLTAFAIALYYVHAGTAFAAVAPYDGVYPRGVFGPWLRRVGLVTVLTVGVTAFIGSIVALTSGARLSAWVTVIGLLLVIATTIFLVRLGRRRA